MTSTLRLALLGSLLAAACGGIAREGSLEGDGGDRGEGGAANNGGHPGGAVPGAGGKVSGGAVPGAGGKVSGGGNAPGYGGKASAGGAIGIGGGIGTGGAIGIAGAAPGCCTAAPICNPGDTQVAGPFFCPPDTSCYEVNLCCTTIWCRRDPTCTEKIAPCLPGYVPLGDVFCPLGGSCYLRTICGSVVTCFSPALPDAGTSVDAGCGGPPPRGVHYVSTSPGQCALLCPSGTSGYSDTCGCGCRQSDNCPDYVDCFGMRTGAPTNPLCSDTSICPYTVRAF